MPPTDWKRDDADETAGRSTRIVLIQIAVAIGIALGVGFVLGRDLSRPLGQLSRIIGRLAAGDLDLDVPSRLSARRDEIGGVARATAVFREAMQQNARAGAEREQEHQRAETEKVEALRTAADSIERETTTVAERSSRSGVLLSDRAQELAASAARMLASVDSAADASNEALHSCEIVAAAGEKLSGSAKSPPRSPSPLPKSPAQRGPGNKPAGLSMRLPRRWVRSARLPS